MTQENNQKSGNVRLTIRDTGKPDEVVTMTADRYCEFLGRLEDMGLSHLLRSTRQQEGVV